MIGYETNAREQLLQSRYAESPQLVRTYNRWITDLVPQKYRPGTPNTSMFAFVIVKLVMRVSVKKIYFQMFEQHSPVIKLVL